jgi:serine/threonine protein kinase
MIGQTVSHYRIVEKIGEGAMGVVYLAEDTHLGRRVAVKFLSAAHDHHYRARFLREARAISMLSHAHVAIVHDYGETGEGQPFIVMEYIKGQTLSQLLLQSALTIRRAVEIIESVAEALGAAHNQGIIHRDVKPSNVLVDEAGQVKVLDFGLAKQIYENPLQGISPDAKTLLEARTGSNVVVGTPLYLSPEQATGATVDARSDLFALGTLLYECLTGKPAFAGGSILEIGAQIIHFNPLPPSSINERVTPELDRIALKALEKRPEMRYQSASEFAADLRMSRISLNDKSGHRTQRLHVA